VIGGRGKTPAESEIGCRKRGVVRRLRASQHKRRRENVR